MVGTEQPDVLIEVDYFKEGKYSVSNNGKIVKEDKSPITAVLFAKDVYDNAIMNDRTATMEFSEAVKILCALAQKELACGN